MHVGPCDTVDMCRLVNYLFLHIAKCGRLVEGWLCSSNFCEITDIAVISFSFNLSFSKLLLSFSSANERVLGQRTTSSICTDTLIHIWDLGLYKVVSSFASSFPRLTLLCVAVILSIFPDELNVKNPTWII